MKPAVGPDRSACGELRDVLMCIRFGPYDLIAVK